MTKDLDAYFRAKGIKPPTEEETRQFCVEGIRLNRARILQEAERLISAERNKTNG